MASPNIVISRLLAMTLLGLASCASTRENPPPAAAGPVPILAIQHGRVASVNAASHYLVLECAVLPKENEEITLFRGNEQTGRVKINRHISGNFAAADILDGDPAVGDTFVEKPARSNP